MSLVHEALEKAKREASAKTARELGLPDPSNGSGQPFRARRRPHPAAIATATALFTLVLVAAALWLFRAPNAPPSAEPTPSTAKAASSSAPASESPAAAVAAPARPVEASPVAAIVPLADPGAPAAAPAARIEVAPAPPTTRPSAPARASAATAPLAATASSFRRETTLADGTVLRLGGIAWSEEAPLAYLNGRLYVKGERVAGMRVERIERDRVLLVGTEGRRLYLTLR